MIEVGIASVEAVFDWRKYLKDEYNLVVPVVNNMKKEPKEDSEDIIS